jgi:hypothetical protein
MLFAKGYLRWRRVECRSFLTEALHTFEGSASRCIVDNSSVVLARGSGADAEVAPEMEALARRFGFSFVAHEKGDANRSARVERPFSFIERNFYPGRSFDSLADLNARLRSWCDRVNRRPKKGIEGTPIERLVTERPALKPLPPYLPPVYELHMRRVDVEGYVSLYTNRYSVPTAFIGRRLEVREHEEKLQVFEGHRLVAEHTPLEPGLGRRVTLPEHLGEKRRWKSPPPPSPEEMALRVAAPELDALAQALRRRHGGRAMRPMRQLYRIYVDYPLPSIVGALRTALAHNLTDLGRIERMILKGIQGQFFRLSAGSERATRSEESGDDG